MKIGINVDISGLDDLYEDADDLIHKETITLLAKIGEEYVKSARTEGNYTDRTGNLRAANSYRIYLNGVNVMQSIGMPETGRLFDEAHVYNQGIEFMVGNGMEYASYVEGLGYDVVTSAFMEVMQKVERVFG